MAFLGAYCITVVFVVYFLTLALPEILNILLPKVFNRAPHKEFASILPAYIKTNFAITQSKCLETGN